MPILLIGLPLLLVVVVANLVAVRGGSSSRLTFNLLLFVGHALLLIVGLSLRFLPMEAQLEELGLATAGANLTTISLIAIGLWGMAASLSPVRRALARVLPGLEPESPVHTLALVLAGYLMSNALLSLESGALESLVEAGGAASLFDVLAQQVLFFLAAFLGVGLLTRRDGPALKERLGLVRPTPLQIVSGVGLIAALVAFQSCIALIWALLDPAQAIETGGINQSLLGDFDTVGEWFLLAVSAGLGEELLFRGALQPVFGILPTSLIFAVSHVQYGFSPAALAILLLSIVLGIIRKRQNTTMAILVHAGYNFVLGLFSLLAVYLQSAAG
jgi:membrane protease YdiL (CAAX protease family)